MTANGKDSIWTEGPGGRVEQLKKLWADGISASAIAKEFGCFGHCDDDGRSAVIGKVHRLGLSRTKKSGSKSRGAKSWGWKTSTKTLEHANGTKVSGAKVTTPPEPDEDETIVMPLVQRCGLDVLHDAERPKCHWPVGNPIGADVMKGDANFFFCGGNQAPGSSYCAYHARRSYASPREYRQYGRSRTA